MSDQAKLLALYLLTCSHNNLAGTFRLPDGYILEDTGWDAERVSKGFEELFRNGFAERCPTTKWVWIRKHLEWNPPQNPNQWKAVAKVHAGIPEACVWRGSALKIETVTEGFPNPPYPSPSPSLGGVGEKKPRKPKALPTQIPEGFRVSDRVLKWATQQGLAGVLDLHLEAFVSTCRAKGYTYVDWDEAFMNAVRKNWAQIEKPKGSGPLKVAV